MPYPQPPGVYFEPADPPIGAVLESRTDVAGFVGIAERGPLHEPVRVDSWTQFETRFGRRFLSYGFLPDAVHGFFANGGRVAWIVRVGRPLDSAPQRHAGVYLVNAKNEPVFLVQARDPGLGGRSISVRVTQGVRERFHLQVTADDGAVSETWRDLEGEKYRYDAAPTTRRDDLEIQEINDRYVVLVVNGVDADASGRIKRPAALRTTGSCLITVKRIVKSPAIDSRVVGVGVWRAKDGATSVKLASGPIAAEMPLGWGDVRGSKPPWSARSVLEGLQLVHFIGDRNSPDQMFGLASLETIDEVAIVAIPDLTWAAPTPPERPRTVHPCSKDILDEMPPPTESRMPLRNEDRVSGQLAMLNHCMLMRDRFAVLDAPYKLSPEGIEQWASKLQSYAGQFGALYYPWAGVPAKKASIHWMPPSGHVAGVYARVDLLTGVQKSPANEALSEVQAVDRALSPETHGRLNSVGVNVLTSTASRGVRVMGARTLIDWRDSQLRQWQYVAVRRLLLMIEESLDESAQRFVHGGNQPVNWLDMEAVVRNFLLRQWRAGRLDGATPEEAFSVECSGRTNPPFERDLGRMMCEIGVQPPQPSEYVFVRLGGRGNETGAWKQGESHA